MTQSSLLITIRYSSPGVLLLSGLTPLHRIPEPAEQDVGPSGSGFCDFRPAAGGGEQLADAAHRLFGCCQLAEASQALGLQQLVFEVGQPRPLLDLGQRAQDN